MAANTENEKYAYLNRLSTQELKDMLRADFEAECEIEIDCIFHILEVIGDREKENTEAQLPDANKAWEEFQQYYNIPEGKGVSLYPYEQADRGKTPVSPLRGFLRKPHFESFYKYRWLGNVTAALLFLIILFSGTLIAQAFGLDVFGTLGRWTEETFRFVPGDDSTSKGPDFASEENYTTIQEALERCDIRENLVPSWYPAGMTASETKIFRDEYSITVYCSFSNEESKFFNIDVTLYQSANDIGDFIFEKDDTPVDQYTRNEKTFYIFSNEDTLTATWASGNLVETISGNLQIEELKKIIDSIGGQ